MYKRSGKWTLVSAGAAANLSGWPSGEVEFPGLGRRWLGLSSVCVIGRVCAAGDAVTGVIDQMIGYHRDLKDVLDIALT